MTFYWGADLGRGAVIPILVHTRGVAGVSTRVPLSGGAPPPRPVAGKGRALPHGGTAVGIERAGSVIREGQGQSHLGAVGTSGLQGDVGVCLELMWNNVEALHPYISTAKNIHIQCTHTLRQK